MNNFLKYCKEKKKHLLILLFNVGLTLRFLVQKMALQLVDRTRKETKWKELERRLREVEKRELQLKKEKKKVEKWLQRKNKMDVERHDATKCKKRSLVELNEVKVRLINSPCLSVAFCLVCYV